MNSIRKNAKKKPQKQKRKKNAAKNSKRKTKKNNSEHKKDAEKSASFFFALFANKRNGVSFLFYLSGFSLILITLKTQPRLKVKQKTAVGLNDGGRDSKAQSSGGAFCPLC